MRYENVFHGSTLLASQRDAARVLCNGRSRPSLHIGGQLQGGDWLRFRQKPLAASGGFSLVSFPGSVLFNAFSNWCYYTTMLCPCQEHKSPSGGKYSENFHPRSRWSSAARPNRAARVMVSRSASPEAASSFSRRVRRNSPRRESSPARRHTSFTAVDVMPELPDDVDVEINMDDVRVDYFRASGAGGQHVNKTSSAVRMTHMPTGIVVQCQNERSQLQNKEMCLKYLRAKLFELEQEKQEKLKAEIGGVHQAIEWGSQIRSYVFHPYNLVKDHRTNVETGNIQAVMDGDLDIFIEGYLQQEKEKKLAKQEL